VTKFHNHIPWLDASKPTTNYAAMVEEVMRVYLAHFQDITPSANIYMSLDVEHLLSWHPTKLEFEFSMISKL